MVKTPLIAADKTVLKSLSLGGVSGGGVPCAVDVKNGKIVRIRPLHFDWKYDPEKLNIWKLRRNGKTFTPLMKSLPSPFSLKESMTRLRGYVSRPGLWEEVTSHPAVYNRHRQIE